MADNLIRVQPHDPTRCQGIREGMKGQCSFKAVEGGKYCVIHGGAQTINTQQKMSLNSYRLGKYQQRMREFSTAPKLRAVDEEIAILRILLEQIFERCQGSNDIQLYSQKIIEIVREITKCVLAADKLALRDGMLIGREEALKIGQKVLEIIPKYIKDQDDLLRIADELTDAFTTKVPASMGDNFGFENE